MYQNLISSNFVNASLVSHLERYRGKRLFRKDWKQGLYVLTNVGILAYDEPDDKRPSSLIPVIDTSLNEVPQTTYGRKYVFSLRTISEEFIFAAVSQSDYSQWISCVKKLKAETDIKMKKIAEKQNVQMSKSFVEPAGEKLQGIKKK